MAGSRRVSRRRVSTSSTRRSYRSTSTRRQRTRSTVTWSVSESFYRDVANELYDRLGLADLGLSLDEFYELVKPVIDAVLEQYSSRPTKEQVVNRIMRNVDKLKELIANYLVDTREELNEQQLEFVIYYGGAGLARHVQRLYQLARKYKRDDLIDYLRAKWEELGLATPYECPYCGFRAVTPELVCQVCGAQLSEEEFKKAIDFENLLAEFAENASKHDIDEVLSTRRVYVDGYTIKPPSAPRSQYAVEVFLSKDEVDKLVKAARK